MGHAQLKLQLNAPIDLPNAECGAHVAATRSPAHAVPLSREPCQQALTLWRCRHDTQHANERASGQAHGLLLQRLQLTRHAVLHYVSNHSTGLEAGCAGKMEASYKHATRWSHTG
jgi:hypothetical protein